MAWLRSTLGICIAAAAVCGGTARGVGNDFASPGREPPVPPALVPPPAPSGGTHEEQFESLQRRIAELEEAEADRDQADADRKAADTAKKAADAKLPTLNWTGQLQADFYAFDQDEENKAEYGDIENGEAFRRARFGMFGGYGPSEYRIEMDFALSGRPSFLDVWAGLKDVPYVGRVRVGHFFEPFFLDRQTPNRYVTFMERSLPDQPFAPARNMGVMANNTYLDQRGTWALGYFRSDSDVFGDDVGDGFENAITGRVTGLPWYDEASGGREYVHLGFGYSFRGTNGDQVQFRSQPEARIGAASPNVPYFAGTGSIPADSFQLIGFEAAIVEGPFHLTSEYVLTPVNADPVRGRPNDVLLFHGWYAETGYFLTGEHRPYRRDIGTFDRVIPKRDFLRYRGEPKEKCVELGPGAWQIAARVSTLDLNDGVVRGGDLVDTTLGLNWHLNPYLRVTTNWVHAFVRSAPGDGPPSDADIFGLRVGYDF